MKRYLVERELIQNNIQVLQKKAGSAVIWAVLKGNGYGLGLLPMAETCRAAGLDHFAVTEIAEARALREGGFETEPILMLQPTADADEITALLPLHVIFTISSTEDASVLAGLAAQAGVTAEAHIKIDTGMGRYGFLPEEMEKITPVYHYMDTIHVTGIYTHLHSAFCDKKATKAQIESFSRVLAALREAGIEPGMAHILNSSGVLHFSGAAMDAVRVGSALAWPRPRRAWAQARRVLRDAGGRAEMAAQGAHDGIWRGMEGEAADARRNFARRLVQRIWLRDGQRFIPLPRLSAAHRRKPAHDALRESLLCDDQRQALQGARPYRDAAHSGRRQRHPVLAGRHGARGDQSADAEGDGRGMAVTMGHPIAAIATGHGRSGIGILRMSGEGCIERAAKVFTRADGRPLEAAEDRKLVLGTMTDAEGRPVDHCMAFISRAPHSYTGEDTVEFQCHGSPAALTAGLEALFAAGFRQAGPGEFTRRAFLNGQMDLTQAEAVIDLIDAETADAAANAAGQLAGAILRKIDPIYDNLVDILAHFHAVLDYPDEDIDPFELAQFAGQLDGDAKALNRLLATCHRGRIVKDGLSAVILGSPNAGKSSLLNCLAGFDRVIVTDIPGTTRDAVEQTVRLGRHLLRLLDTAGIRETDDQIERMGVERSLAAAQEADLALFVVDGSKPFSAEDQEAMDAALGARACIALMNKTDLGQVIEASDLPFDYVVPISAKTGAGMELLEQAMDMLFADDAPCDGSLLTNARQAEAIVSGRAIRCVLRSGRCRPA
ncbi:MAG: tRNA uridine-5-carboxymethylaminomethyl(34) synthesis GTPase MnmE [Oscillospiraceae bacterium]